MIEEADSMRVVILEDCVDRETAMRASIADKFPAFIVEVFASVPLLIQRLSETGLYDVALVSLDHDLEMVDTGEQDLVDPGTGVDAAKWLATQPAVTPVIVHTTNTVGGDRMVELLMNGDWNVERVVPYGGDDWIGEHWRSVVRNLVVAYAPNTDLCFQGIQITACGLKNSQSVEWMIREILKAALASLGADPGICLELGYLKPEGRWGDIAGTGRQVLRNYVGGTAFEFLQDVADSMPGGEGPVCLENSSISQAWRDELQRWNVRVVQIRHIKLRAGMAAVLFIASSSDSHGLDSRWIQGVFRKLSALLAMVLEIELAAETDRKSKVRLI